MRHLSSACACFWFAACLSGPSGAPLQEPLDLRVPELGYLGYQPPEVTAVRLSDAVAHQDVTGGCLQTPLAIAGAAEGGFAVVWRDMRDGSAGLYFGRFDSDGSAREPERSICLPHTTRRTDATIALAPDGAGTVAWTSALGVASVPFVHGFDAQGVIQGYERPASAPVNPAPGDVLLPGRDDAEVSCRKPVATRLPAGRSALTWTRGGRIFWIERQPSGELAGAPMEWDPNAPAAEDGVRVASNPAGISACAWRTKAGEALVTLRSGNRAGTTPIGPGNPQSIQADPGGGWWVLVRVENRSVLRHLGSSGAVDRPAVEMPPSNVKVEELVVFQDGVGLLRTLGAPTVPPQAATPEGAAVSAPESALPEGTVTLTLCDAAGQPRAGGTFVVPSAAAREVESARCASNGRVLFVVWQDARGGDPDVYGRIVDPTAGAAPRLGPERRLNTDTATTNQIHGSVSSCGERGLITWCDERALPSRVYMRRFGTSGFSADELALPVAHGAEAPAPGTASALRPASACRADGAALVCWREVEGRDRQRLRGQIVAQNGTGLSRVLEFDDGLLGAPGDPAVTALAGHQGWTVAWPRAGRSGVFCRRVLADGELAPNAARVSEPGDGEESDVDIEALDDGRLMCAWTSRVAGGPWSIRGRFLDGTTGQTRGPEIHFAHSLRGNDWDPSLAPADDGGFAMSWTAGSTDDPVRDAVVCLFDAAGTARELYVTVCFTANEQDFTEVVRLADRSFAVSWEDDISYVDQAYVRRFARDGRSLGPMMRINQTETKFLADRAAPRIAAIGDGLAATFADRRRGRGTDALLKLVGPRWDAPPPEASSGPKKD